MKILHISPNKYHPCSWGLIREQAKNNSVFLLALTIIDNNDTSILREYRDEMVNFIEINVSKSVIYHQDKQLEGVFYNLFKKYRPHIVHIHLFSGVNLSPILSVACAFGIKRVLVLHDHSLFCIRGTMHDGMNPCNISSLRECNCQSCHYHANREAKSLKEFNKLRQDLALRMINMCNKVICCSYMQKDKLEQLVGKNERFTVLYYGVSLPKIRKESRKEKKVVTFGFLGTAAYIKGIGVITDAVVRLSSYNFKLIMAIHHRNSAEWDKNIELDKLQQHGKTTILENIRYEKLYSRFFSKIDWLIIPSLWEETGPMTLLEAFFYRIPVIISNRKSMIEKIEGNKSSRVFRDTQELVKIMKGVILRRIKKIKNDVFIAKDIDTYAKDIENLYREILGKESKSVVLKTGYLCNNHCIFCVTGDNAPREFVNFQFLKRILEKYRNFYDSVTLTGGEPLLRKDIFSLLELCYELGYKITLQTNARLFADKDLCRRIKHFNLDIITHLESYKPRQHDFITGINGSFYETVRAICNLREFCPHIAVKIMITKLNYKELPTTGRWLCKLKVDEIWFVYLTPYGRTFTYFDLIVPRYSEVRPYLYESVGILMKKKELEITVEGVPYCCVEAEVRKFILEDMRTDKYRRCGIYPVSKNNYTLYYSFQERQAQKQKFAKCIRCIFYKVCEGVYTRYAERIGDKEFIPVFSKATRRKTYV
ncbi:MAG: radical SAM protein [Candidatus Omnitrophica bacterium]|nr:radical SAM protein [Candidatus Omnitrophota bacterium]